MSRKAMLREIDALHTAAMTPVEAAANTIGRRTVLGLVDMFDQLSAEKNDG